MTREEAKEAIKEAYGNSEYTEEIIKALEQEPFINKACVSRNVCKYDKAVALEKIKTEITKKRDILVKETKSNTINQIGCYGLDYALLLIEKCMAESEE